MRKNISLNNFTLNEMFVYMKNGEKGLQEVLDAYPIGYVSHRKDGEYMKIRQGSGGWIKLEGSENENFEYSKARTSSQRRTLRFLLMEVMMKAGFCKRTVKSQIYSILQKGAPSEL